MLLDMEQLIVELLEVHGVIISIIIMIKMQEDKIELTHNQLILINHN